MLETRVVNLTKSNQFVKDPTKEERRPLSRKQGRPVQRPDDRLSDSKEVHVNLSNNMRRSHLLFATVALAAVEVRGQHSDYQPHYLVGLLNLPNSNIPDIFRNHTSGTYLGQGEYDNWVAHPDAPFSDIPWVGFSDIEPIYVDDDVEEGEPTGGTGGMAGGTMALGKFFCLSDNGYGSSKNSADYPLNIARIKLERPFAFGHGGSSSLFGRYTEAELLGAAYLHDPNGFIKWENG